MKKALVVGVLVIIALAAMAGPIFAQGGDDTESEATAWLGVALAEVDDQVLIARVQSGSPADAADLLIGDVVVSFNGTAITSASDVRDLVQAAAPGDTVTLELVRNGEPLTVDVTLGTSPSALFGNGLENSFSFSGDALSVAEHLLNADLEETDEGFTVTGVSENRNPLELAEDDIITSINEQAVAELDVETLVSDLADMDDPELTVVVTRDGEEMTLTGEVSGLYFNLGGRGGRRGDGGRGFGSHGGLSDAQPGRSMPNASEGAVPSGSASGQL